jgi:hypothetical protein
MQSSRRLKRWMTLVGLAGLAAGIPLGVTIHKAYLQANSQELNWLVRGLKEEYDLRPKQVQLVRAVLQQREFDSRSAYSANHTQLPAELRNKIQDIKRTADERIYAVLDSNQRERYRKDASKALSANK